LGQAERIVPCAILLRDRTLHVCKQRKLEVLVANERLMRPDAIPADTVDLCAGVLERGEALGHVAHLIGADGGKIERVEQQNNGVAAQIGEMHILVVFVLQRKIWRGLAHSDIRHNRSPSLLWRVAAAAATLAIMPDCTAAATTRDRGGGRTAPVRAYCWSMDSLQARAAFETELAREDGLDLTRAALTIGLIERADLDIALV